MNVKNLNRILILFPMKFAAACEEQPTVVAQIPRAQLESMAQRLRDIGPKSKVRAVTLKFLEHKVGITTSLNSFGLGLK